MFMDTLPKCICMQHSHFWCPKMPAEGIRSPGTEITDKSCQVDAGNHTWILWKSIQYSKPSFSPVVGTVCLLFKVQQF